jgi:hypothetical protein
MFKYLLHPSTTFTIAGITVNGAFSTHSTVEINLDHLATLNCIALANDQATSLLLLPPYHPRANTRTALLNGSLYVPMCPYSEQACETEANENHVIRPGSI